LKLAQIQLDAMGLRNHLDAELQVFESGPEDGDAWALKKQGKGYKEKGNEAKEIQAEYDALVKRRDGILKEMGQHRQISIDNANVAHEISEEIAAKDGPLMQEVKLLYDRLRLERKVLPNTMYSWQTHAEAAQK
jgi:hypothetical protein